MLFTPRLSPAERLVKAVGDAHGLADFDRACRRQVPDYDPVPALERLARAGVAFVLLGRLAGVLRGSSVVCSDLVVCPAPARENRARLAAATRPGVEVVDRPRGTSGHADLAASADVMDVGGFAVTVAALDDLIRIGRANAAPSDLIEVEILLALRDETMRE
jgi:hypothetical protein